MAKPVIFAVDDEPAVLSAVARDLRRQYGEEYRILRADSGAAALEAVPQLKLRNEPVALFLVDQRMPGMTGVEFLAEATKEDLFPGAKRILLTAYADKDAAINAINEVGLNYYLMKPWDPPEENLYPVLDEYLDDWQAENAPPFSGIRIVDHRWSARGHDIKDFLKRSVVPFQWLDIEIDEEETKQLMELAGVDRTQLPLVLFDDGTHLVQPTTAEVAEKAGLKTRPNREVYDLIIVGGGPAGLGSAVYGASEGLKTLLVEREATGGQAGTTSLIENYLGFPAGLSGSELTRRAVTQASRFGAEILTPLEATDVRVETPYIFLKLSDGSEIACHALIIASGVQYRRLEAPGVERLTGAGIYYGGVTTEAKGLEGKNAYIVGGGNSAGQAAVFLAEQGAGQINILIRGDSLTDTMSQYLIDRIQSTENIAVRPHSNTIGVDGEDRIASISIQDLETQEVETLPCDALFIYIGAMPRTDWVAKVVERDKFGFIFSGPDVMQNGHRPESWTAKRDPFWLETSTPGIFVAGDVRHESIKRAASAVGEGSMAVQFVHRHLATLGAA